MKKIIIISIVVLAVSTSIVAQPSCFRAPYGHPEMTGFQKLFYDDLSNAVFPEGVWTFVDGILTASEDQCIWSKKLYDDFILDLEFKTAEGTNSGVIIYCSDIDNWIPNSVEVQIADDFSEQWSKSPKTWQCGAIFGHLPPTKSMVKKPGEWNRLSITAKDELVYVILNGERVTFMDMSLWKSASVNPDGSEIPSWLSTPFAELNQEGFIGLQGKHAGAPIYFRNIRIKEIN